MTAFATNFQRNANLARVPCADGTDGTDYPKYNLCEK